jgi:hypothetical protein
MIAFRTYVVHDHLPISILLLEESIEDYTYFVSVVASVKFHVQY